MEEKIEKMMEEYYKSAGFKDDLKRILIDFLKNDELGYLKVDREYTKALTDDEWKEIATEVGEDVYTNYDLVYVAGAIVPEAYLPKRFKAKKQRN